MKTLMEIFLMMVLVYVLVELSYMPKWFRTEWKKYK